MYVAGVNIDYYEGDCGCRGRLAYQVHLLIASMTFCGMVWFYSTLGGRPTGPGLHVKN